MVKQIKCADGYRKKKNKCIKKKESISQHCNLDGKTCYKDGDKSLKPPIARAGGKSQLANKIINKMKPHEIYSEPFFGGGAVFYRKPLAKKSYLNDKDGDVITVHKSFKDGGGVTHCNMTPSKKKFNKIKKKKNKNTCDVIYLNKLSFGSGMTSYADKKFSGKGNSETGITYQKAHKDDYNKKLKHASLSAKDFRAIMNQADSKKTVHFLDPPYVKGSEVYKEKGVTPKEVCDTAKKMKGQVIITYDDNHQVRKSCKGLRMQRMSSNYTLGANSNNKASKELMIIKQ